MERLKVFETPLLKEYHWPLKIFSAIILAPFIEELVFRGFLGPLRGKKYFKWLYYISSILFGLIHLTNFQNRDSLLPFILIITAPQLFLGLMSGYIRIIYGFRYAVLLHAMYNLVLFCIGYGLDYLFGS